MTRAQITELCARIADGMNVDWHSYRPESGAESAALRILRRVSSGRSFADCRAFVERRNWADGVTVVISAASVALGLPAAGEGIEAHVELDPSPQAIALPEEALTVSQGGSAVFVVEGGTARRRTVTTGARSAGRIEITTGVLPGDRVVVVGVDLLTDGAKVTATEKRPAAPAAAPAVEGTAEARP